MQSDSDRDILIERKVPVCMADGVRLYVDLYYPATGGPFPGLLINQPYNRFSAQSHCFAHPIWYARQGYLVVAEDPRGRYESEGDFYPFRSDAEDMAATIDWIARQPVCNGRVGLYGFSYAGMNQLMTAALQPPALVAAAPAFTGSDLYENWHYVGGAFSLGFAATWSLTLSQDIARRLGKPDLQLSLRQAAMEFPQRFWRPMNELYPSGEFRQVAPYYYDWLEHPLRDDYWESFGIQGWYDRIRTPMLHLGGWYDTFIEGTLKNYVHLKIQGNDGRGQPRQRLVVGPWYHMPWSIRVGSVDFGREAANELNEIQVEWFNYWLKDFPGELEDRPPVRIFVMGENCWRYEEDWPIARAQERCFYLHSSGRANSNSGNGWLSPILPEINELPDVYIYDPGNPVPSCGGRSCCFATQSPMGPEDQSPVELRNDVLVYRTDVLHEDIEVTGEITAVLWASSSAPDTDFTVKLVDVYPDGRAINLCDGILRAKFRESFTSSSLIEPGAVYRYEIQVGTTCNLFRKGHRIQVDVSSSNFPLYDRNLNTGQWSKDAGPFDFQPAVQMIFHDPNYPSYVTLPIVPR